MGNIEVQCGVIRDVQRIVSHRDLPLCGLPFGGQAKCFLVDIVSEDTPWLPRGLASSELHFALSATFSA